MRACVYACARAFSYVRARVRVFVCFCVCVCVRACACRLEGPLRKVVETGRAEFALGGCRVTPVRVARPSPFRASVRAAGRVFFRVLFRVFWPGSRWRACSRRGLFCQFFFVRRVRECVGRGNPPPPPPRRRRRRRRKLGRWFQSALARACVRACVCAQGRVADACVRACVRACVVCVCLSVWVRVRAEGVPGDAVALCRPSPSSLSPLPPLSVAPLLALFRRSRRSLSPLPWLSGAPPSLRRLRSPPVGVVEPELSRREDGAWAAGSDGPEDIDRAPAGMSD